MAEPGEAIETYRASLEAFLILEEDDDSQAKVMDVLVARDNVARSLSDHRPLTAETLCALSGLDLKLKGESTNVRELVGPATLANWREAIQPPSSAWWWWLDERDPVLPKPHPLWAILAGLLVIGSFALALDIAMRFFTSGLSFLSVLQFCLALLAGSTLTNFGQQLIARGLTRLGIRLEFQYRWKVWLALGVALCLLALRFSLPAIARGYNNKGVSLQNSGQVSQAIESYQRTISLYPEYAQAHYNLATAYEDVLDYDKAIAEYQTALRSGEQFYDAYNNLARLYILRRQDYANALKTLDRALKLDINLNDQNKTRLRYSLLKNRGWSYFGLKLYDLAEDDLREALKLRPDGAAALCLLAQVLEAKKGGDKEAAIAEWGDCYGYSAGQEDEVEADWLGIAQERLR